MPRVLAVVVSLHLFNVSTASPAVVEQAQKALVEIYAAAGVGVDWNDGPTSRLLIVRDDEPGEFRRTSPPILGVATHTANGTQAAYVFYRRAAAQADRLRLPAAVVLASAMAHEVGHLLLPNIGHAREGLMRACWDDAELVRAATGHLRFSAEEGAAIRGGALAVAADPATR